MWAMNRRLSNSKPWKKDFFSFQLWLFFSRQHSESIKIEANAHASKGIPLTDEDAGKHPKYFEFHVKVAHKSKKDDVAISKEEEEELAEISKKFTQTFQAPIPLSWNNLANPGNHENPGYQRFLNIRFRNTGYKNCSDNLNALHKAINENTNFKVVHPFSWQTVFSFK